MGDYNRSTRECLFNQLRPELARGILDYLLKREMIDLESQISLCCETTSEKKKKGLFAGFGSPDPDQISYSAALITPAWLIWAHSGVKSGVIVSAARWRDLEVKEFDSKLISDSGLDVTGLTTDTPQKGSVFLPLGPDSAGQKFIAVAKTAAKQANR